MAIYDTSHELESTSTGSGPGCSFRGHDAEANVNCNAGLLTISSKTLVATRTVRLTLSDGATIVSPAIRIPSRLGGPAGFYYQVVRGPSPIPVSLTELDRRGDPLRAVHLPAIVECTKHPLKFLPGGIRVLVRSHLPGGPKFTIEAKRYRFLGSVHLDLRANAGEESSGILGGSSSGGSSIVVGNTETGHRLRSGPGRRLFAVEEASGCRPSPYMIVFGILERPAGTVLVRSAAGLVALHKVAMPASLHAGGILAWGAFSPPPSEIIVRAPNGTTLASESIAQQTRGQVEECEGEAE